MCIFFFFFCLSREFVYHEIGNVQNEVAAISKPTTNPSGYIYTDTVATTQQSPCSDMRVGRKETGAEYADSYVVRLVSGRPDRLVCGNIKLICSPEYRSLIISSLFVAPDGLHQFVKLAELLIYSRCIELA